MLRNIADVRPSLKSGISRKEIVSIKKIYKIDHTEIGGFP